MLISTISPFLTSHSHSPTPFRPSQALFHVIIMFVLYHKKQYNSALGNHFLHDPALSLSAVRVRAL